MRTRFLALAPMLAAACATSSQPGASSAGSDDPCADLASSVTKVWNEQTKVNVQLSVMNHWGGQLGVDVAHQRAESVTADMDRIAQDWVNLRRAVCMDHFKRGVGTEAAYQGRVSCFDNVLQHQRSAVIALERGSENAFAQLDALGEVLQQCR